jgi:hypothetical protein
MLCGQDADLLHVEAGGTYNKNWASKGDQSCQHVKLWYDDTE